MRNPDRNQGTRHPAGPDRETVIETIRQAVGPNLDGLSQATQAVKESRRLLELAHWAGDQEAEEALRQALRLLWTASGGR